MRQLISRIVVLANCLTWLFPCSSLAVSPLEQAIKAYHAGNYTEAIGRFGQAESTEFNNPKLHYYLANALAKTNQKQDAIKQYKVALALEPTGQLAEYCRQDLQAFGAFSP
jgi:tetratricopeptide (TPR) repeat protein